MGRLASAEAKQRHRETQKRWREENRERVRELHKEWRARNPGKYRDTQLKYKRKSLPTPTRPSPERCECCGFKPDERVLSLDHDHRSNTFRGWLCRLCNTGIGKLGDDILGLENAIAYLRRAEQAAKQG